MSYCSLFLTIQAHKHGPPRAYYSTFLVADKDKGLAIHLMWNPDPTLFQIRIRTTTLTGNIIGSLVFYQGNNVACILLKSQKYPYRYQTCVECNTVQF